MMRIEDKNVVDMNLNPFSAQGESGEKVVVEAGERGDAVKGKRKAHV